jgi:hypothetical protein
MTKKERAAVVAEAIALMKAPVVVTAPEERTDEDGTVWRRCCGHTEHDDCGDRSPVPDASSSSGAEAVWEYSPQH